MPPPCFVPRGSALLMFLDKRHKLFLVLAAVFVTCFVVGDIIGGKLVEVRLFGFSWATTVGMIPFPVTFLLTDLLNEFYGKRAARFVTLVGFCMAALAFTFIIIAGTVPIHPMTRSPTWDNVTDAGFNNVFMGARRILIASLIAYLVAQFIDIGVFHLLKRATQSRMLWLRATGSTAASQMIDTITISFIGWYGEMPVPQIITMIYMNYILKLLIAVGLTPLIYLSHALVERGLGIQPILIGDAPDDAVVASATRAE
jgi:queuosine precursor transporter